MAMRSNGLDELGLDYIRGIGPNWYRPNDNLS